MGSHQETDLALESSGEALHKMAAGEISRKGDKTQEKWCRVNRSSLNSDSEEMTVESSSTEDKDRLAEIGAQQECRPRGGS